jgi:mono/diheme cytochrome c family protein
MRREILLIILIAILSLGLAAQTVTKASAKYTSPASGSEMFKAYCASCHGIDAKGNGPAATAMKAAMPDLTRLSVVNKGKFPTDHVQALIEGQGLNAHGSPEMPVWGPVFRHMDDHSSAKMQQRVRNLTKYIESIQAM